MANMRIHLYAVLSLVAVSCCSAQFTRTIKCPAGRVHKDTRQEIKDTGKAVGGEEYCVLELPGYLEVHDGPYRFWFNPDFERAEGTYKLGRQFGRWKECDRFDHCEQKNYPEFDPDEKQRAGVKPEVPVAYDHGKYVFDFSSVFLFVFFIL